MGEIEDNMPLVKHIAGKIAKGHRHIPLDDLVSDGAQGLLHAQKTFDARKGKFGKWAAGCIRTAILQGIKAQGWWQPRVGPVHPECMRDGDFYSTDDIHNNVACTQLAQVLVKEIKKLPTHEAEVLKGYCYGRTRAELVTELGISRGSVHNYKRSAIKKLQDVIAKEGFKLT